MKRSKIRSAFTLVEVLIVVVIMAILAATIIPQFSDSTKDAKASSAKFNVHTLRAQIELYKSQHDGTPPGSTLIELTRSTNTAGTQGTGANFPYGPYIREIPKSPFNNAGTVKVITTNPAAVGDVTAANAGAWLYNATTGGIWLDHSDYYTY